MYSGFSWRSSYVCSYGLSHQLRAGSAVFAGLYGVALMMLVTLFCEWFFLRYEGLRAGFRKSPVNEPYVVVPLKLLDFTRYKVRPAPGSIPSSHVVRVPKQSLVWAGTGFPGQIGTLLP